MPMPPGSTSCLPGLGRSALEPAGQARGRVGPASRRAVGQDVRPGRVAGVQAGPRGDRDPPRWWRLASHRRRPRRHRTVPDAVPNTQARPGMGGQPRWRCVMRRRLQHGVPVIGALVLLALLAVIAAAIEIAEHLTLLAVIAAVVAGPSTWASCTSEGAHDRVRSSRGRPGQRGAQPPRHCQQPRCRWLTTARTRRWLTSGRPGGQTGTRCSLTRYPALTRSGGRDEPARLHRERLPESHGPDGPGPDQRRDHGGDRRVQADHRPHAQRPVEPACGPLDAAARPLAADRRDQGLHGSGLYHGRPDRAGPRQRPVPAGHRRGPQARPVAPAAPWKPWASRSARAAGRSTTGACTTCSSGRSSRTARCTRTPSASGDG